MFPELHRVDLEALNNQSLSFLFPGCSFCSSYWTQMAEKQKKQELIHYLFIHVKTPWYPSNLFFFFSLFSNLNLNISACAEIHQWWNINHHRYQMDSSNNRKPLHTPTIPTNTELSLMFNFNYQLPSIKDCLTESSST